MTKNITKPKESIWNERFELRMKELGLSQRKFIALYKERFGTGSQADVSKWMHIGEKDNRHKRGRKFPEFETMRNIAELLDVSVGYLIGETDCETFEMERASRYMGISRNAIESIRNITSGKSIPPFYKYPDSQVTAALELLLTNSNLIDYLKNVCAIAEAINRSENPIGYFKRATENIPEELRDNVFLLWNDAEEAKAKGIEQTKELWDYVGKLDDAAQKDMYQPDFADRDIKSSKYALQESHIKMVDELISPNNIKDLLPRYLTEDEVKSIFRKK